MDEIEIIAKPVTMQTGQVFASGTLRADTRFREYRARLLAQSYAAGVLLEQNELNTMQPCLIEWDDTRSPAQDCYKEVT